MVEKKLVTASEDLCRRTLGSRSSDHSNSWVAEQTALFLSKTDKNLQYQNIVKRHKKLSVTFLMKV